MVNVPLAAPGTAVFHAAQLTWIAAWHAPPPHVSPPPHTTPQAPQLLLSLLRLVSQPLPTLPSQLPKPALHDDTAHALAMQVGVALARLQALPHAPQLDTLDVR